MVVSDWELFKVAGDHVAEPVGHATGTVSTAVCGE